jgi:hypothetical protein
MAAGFLLMSAGVSVATFMRSKRWWLKMHKVFGIAVVACMFAGFFAAVIFVEDSSGIHFRILHARTGAVTIIVAAITPILGFMHFKIRNPQVKVIHKWLGRAALTFALATIILGLSAVGLL